MEITPLIYKTLENENKQWSPVNHNPSSAGFVYSDGRVVGPDLLSSYYKWMGIKPTNPSDGKSILRMKLGDGTHMVLAQILAKAGIKAKSEVKGALEIQGLKHKMSYRVDQLYEVDNLLEVGEIKSTDDDAMFGNQYYGGIKEEGVKPDHLLQVICYLNAEPGVKRGRIIYIARDSGEILEFVVEKLDGDRYAVDGKPVPELSFAGIVARWKELETALETKQPPTPSYHAWLKYAEDGSVESIIKIKQINGKKYKSDWRTGFDNYADLIWKDPKNKPFSYNEIFRAKGIYVGA
jgi:hypothetical protein